jgi:hypothetical protein
MPEQRPTFEEWMRQVNRIVQRIAGVSTDDIGDSCYRDNYDAGTTPEHMAHAALADSDFPFGEED